VISSPTDSLASKSRTGLQKPTKRRKETGVFQVWNKDMETENMGISTKNQ
jgi:hypothetical protein